MAKARTGAFDLLLEVQGRSTAEKQPNGEEPEQWGGVAQYPAAREELTAGQVIAQGLAAATGGMRVRIKGTAIPVYTFDRVRVVTTDEVYSVTGVYRDRADTVLTLELAAGQTTPFPP